MSSTSARTATTNKSGEIRALLAIAWPMIIAQTAQSGTGVVDTIMAGRYDAVDLAAIAIGYNIWLPLALFFIGLSLGATTIIAQDFGAGRIEKIRESLPQALWLALAVGLAAGPLCYSAAPLLDLLDLDQVTYDKSLDYLQAVAFGLPAMAVFQALRCHTQGIGIMRPFAVASVIGFLANIPLNYALIYGRWGAPELGAAGCGWATAISMWLSPVLISFYMLRARALQPYLPARWSLPRLAAIREIWRLGLPMGTSFFLEIAVFSIISLLIATLGNTAMASHQIAFNVWDVVYIFLISIGSAMGTRVGHAIGAGDRPGVHRALVCGGAVNIVIAVLCMAVLLGAPALIISAYTEDAAIHAMATGLITLAGFFVIIDSVHITVTFCLRAYKDTLFPFLILCACYWLVTLPVGYWLGIVIADTAAAGTLGFWRAMIGGVALATLILFVRLRWRLRQALPEPADIDADNPSALQV
ncbi:MAG: MATE family efflux transporter [Xanthomonadales bacterium]|nr:MATE family efflux transporter [Xanthomonadales bacterium]